LSSWLRCAVALCFGRSSTRARALAAGVKAQEPLNRNDARHFSKPLGDLVAPGPRFTNLNDFRAVLIV
jgi:glycerate 2-kinase